MFLYNHCSCQVVIVNITFDFDISLFMLDMSDTIIRHSVLFIVYLKK